VSSSRSRPSRRVLLLVIKRSFSPLSLRPLKLRDTFTPAKTDDIYRPFEACSVPVSFYGGPLVYAPPPPVLLLTRLRTASRSERGVGVGVGFGWG